MISLTPRVVGVLLAAGASVRLGTPKQLVTFRGETLLRRAARALVEACCARAVVVVGADGDRMQEPLRDLPVRIAMCAAWSEGIAASLRSGVAAAVEERADAVLITLVDQPLVTCSHLHRLIEAHASTSAAIVASRYAGVCGVPALFGRPLFGELLALAGDRGARDLIVRHARVVAPVDLAEAEFDLDRAEDLARLAVLDPPGEGP